MTTLPVTLHAVSHSLPYAGPHLLPYAGPPLADHSGAAGSSISAVVIAAVLGSAVLHAAWNAIAHGVADRLIGFTAIGIAYTGCGAAIVLVSEVPPLAAWPYIVASAVLHIGYQLLLLASYQLGQFSQVYPLARGTSPWVVAVVAATVLGQTLPPLELAGVMIVSAGLISLVFIGGRPTRAQLPALGAAFGTGLLIAAYTVVDGIGVRHAPVVAYSGWLFFLLGPALPLFAVVRRGRALPGQLRPSLVVGLTGGMVSLVAYGLVLWAQTRGALAPIAALRETSIIIGAAIGAVWFGERFGIGRAVAGVVVVMGIVLINVPSGH